MTQTINRPSRVLLPFQLCGALLAAGALIAVPAAARAQSTALETLTIELWPEFDKPASVLVLCEASLPATAQIPAVVEIPIPIAVVKPHAVAKKGTDGQLYNIDYERKVRDGQAYLVMTTDSFDVRVEYYAPVSVAKTAREFAFTWPGSVAVQTLDYVAQVPKDAANYVVTPASSKQDVGSNGLNYHFGSLGSKAAGEAITITIRYDRATSVPSVGNAPPPAAAVASSALPKTSFAATADAPKPPESNSNPTWFVVAVLAVLVLAVGYWMGRSGGEA